MAQFERLSPDTFPEAGIFRISKDSFVKYRRKTA
jgi:hypothetical protein